jgi:membrane-associated protein
VAEILDWLSTQHGVTVALVVGALLIVETSLFLGLLVPGDGVVLLAGATVTSAAEFPLLVLVAVVGALIGETGGYLIGYHCGPWVRRSRGGRWLGERNWTRAELLVLGKGGGWALVGSRFIPLMHAMVPLLAGMLRMPYRRFLVWEAAAAVVWSTCYVTIGALVGSTLRYHGHIIGYVISALILLITFTLTHLLSRRREPAETADAALKPGK